MRQTFSWKETTLSHRGQSVVVLQGLAVVAKDLAPKLLACSGLGGVFFSFDKASLQKKIPVVWSQRQDEESLVQYLQRVQDEAKAKGTAIAWRLGAPMQLGFRCEPGKAATTAGLTVAFRVRKVPTSWSQTELVEALESAGWREVIVTFPKRPWFIEVTKDAILLLDRVVSRNSVKVTSQSNVGRPRRRNSEVPSVQVPNITREPAKKRAGEDIEQVEARTPDMELETSEKTEEDVVMEDDKESDPNSKGPGEGPLRPLACVPPCRAPGPVL